jgi:hypothetical protein
VSGEADFRKRLREFAELREDWLRKSLKIPNGIPSCNTFSRVIQAIDPTVFATCIATHLGKLGFGMEGGQIAFDGKALRGSRSGDTSHLHAVSVGLRGGEVEPLIHLF